MTFQIKFLWHNLANQQSLEKTDNYSTHLLLAETKFCIDTSVFEEFILNIGMREIAMPFKY